jgi:hypothetical protein
MKDWKDLTVTKTDKGESRQIFDRPSSMFERFDMHATNLDAGYDQSSAAYAQGRRNYIDDKRRRANADQRRLS